MRAALTSKIADERFMAAFVVGEKRLRWPSDLIPLLDDPTDLIRQAARRSLIILSFLELNPEEAARLAAPVAGQEPTPLSKLNKPVDFGPASGAGKAVRKTAMEKWTDWWASRDSSKKGNATAGTSLKSVGVAADAERLVDTLVKAEPDARKALIEEYRDAKGVRYTEALAAAIGRAPSAARPEMRNALADRMGRMTEATLGRYLDDPLPEIRRAAALGLAKKGITAHASRLADLLNDPDVAVVAGAHDALRQLSGEDFGPDAGSSESDRAESAVKWRKWWQMKKNSGKPG
ncbi:MAG TPA: hypothetical protein VHR66_16490 [Gemmataceae bacterium]|nr:hypothetical protein [Gemmataceae bacterium]